jgi:branched-chain amino acid transport system substrate-binding protein
LAEQNKILLLAPTASAAKITTAGDHIFRIRETASIHGRAMAQYAYSKKWYNVSVLTANTENGLSYSDAFEKEFVRLGGKVVSYELVEKDQRDFRTQVEKLLLPSPEFIYVSGLPDGLGRNVRAIREKNANVPIIASAGAEDPEFLHVGKEATEEVLLSSPIGSVADSFALLYNNTYNSTAYSVTILNTYDAANIIKEITKKCNTVTCMKDALYSLTYEGVGGRLTFDENGDVHRSVYIKKIRNGTFEMVS